MELFLERYYRVLLYGLIAILMVLSFLIGREEGSRSSAEGVVLSCSEEVLATLRIPPQGPREEQNEPFRASPEPAVLSESTAAPQGKFVGSKNGTKYYTPECSGAKRIKPENYVWFIDEEDAKLQGYTPAAC